MTIIKLKEDLVINNGCDDCPFSNVLVDFEKQILEEANCSLHTGPRDIRDPDYPNVVRSDFPFDCPIVSIDKVES